ncbi:hypothetical protein LEN26_012418 [Aphanomyces euteiches]|nr:hypothetical protein LEN26_012418 [Aphanomyces euteiches]KAH9129509.1 hypothetical protein AeMF1_000436 [Aphanomyces euteiches]KAH9190884.1 hypothetical protein AeNC1_007140 [Aphanomyces euteiches]
MAKFLRLVQYNLLFHAWERKELLHLGCSYYEETVASGAGVDYDDDDDMHHMLHLTKSDGQWECSFSPTFYEKECQFQIRKKEEKRHADAEQAFLQGFEHFHMTAGWRERTLTVARVGHWRQTHV